MKIIKFDFETFKSFIQQINEYTVEPQKLGDFTEFMELLFVRNLQPRNGAITKNLVNFLIHKNQLEIHESRSSEKSFIVWNKNLTYDLHSMYNDLFTYIREVKTERESIKRVAITQKPIKREFGLHAHVFFICDNTIVEGIIKGIYLNDDDDDNSICYTVVYKNKNNEICKKQMSGQLFETVDELITYFKSTLIKF